MGIEESKRDRLGPQFTWAKTVHNGLATLRPPYITHSGVNISEGLTLYMIPIFVSVY